MAPRRSERVAQRRQPTTPCVALQAASWQNAGDEQRTTTAVARAPAAHPRTRQDHRATPDQTAPPPPLVTPRVRHSLGPERAEQRSLGARPGDPPTRHVVAHLRHLRCHAPFVARTAGATDHLNSQLGGVDHPRPRRERGNPPRVAALDAYLTRVYDRGAGGEVRRKRGALVPRGGR